MTKVKIGLVQKKIADDLEYNLTETAKSVRDLATQGADFIVLTEMFNCPYGPKYFPKFAEPQGGETFNTLSKLAEENSVYLIAGSVPEKDGDNIYNTSYTFDRKGKLINKHRKVHLFDIDIRDGVQFFESHSFKPGNDFTVFDTEFGKMAVAVCFDIRFSEEFQKMAKEGAKIIFVPGAFNLTTGPAHWQMTFRSRAVDNQLFMVGVSPARDMDFSYHAYGHSLVADPWGEVVYEMGHEPEDKLVEINLNKIEKIRGQLPIFYGRNPHLKPE